MRELESQAVEPCRGVEVACVEHSPETLIPVLEVVVFLEDNLIVEALQLVRAVAVCLDQRNRGKDLSAQTQGSVYPEAEHRRRNLVEDP